MDNGDLTDEIFKAKEYMGGTCEIKGYDLYGSMESPLGAPTAGRTNLEGVSYLYMNDTEGAACAEIKTKVGAYISLATIRPKRELKMANFCFDERRLSSNKLKRMFDEKFMDFKTCISGIFWLYSTLKSDSEQDIYWHPRLFLNM